MTTNEKLNALRRIAGIMEQFPDEVPMALILLKEDGCTICPLVNELADEILSDIVRMIQTGKLNIVDL